MKEILLEITNESGLHLRPAAEFVKKAGEFKSEITIEKDGKEVNAKSILHVQSLGVRQGMKVTIKAQGEDEEEALQALKGLVENRFGEG